jgi:hypothetical protein
MNENLFSGIECSELEVITWQREQEENQREWQIEKERRLMDWRNFTLEGERQLHDLHKTRNHPDRLLRRASKSVKSLLRALWEGAPTPTNKATELGSGLYRKEKRIRKKVIRRSEGFLRQFCNDETGEKFLASQRLGRQELYLGGRRCVADVKAPRRKAKTAPI